MMKRILLAVALLLGGTAFAQDYIVIGWNDLGMHCANKDFSQLVVLPPYNNLRCQVIRLGDAGNLPLVVTTDFHVTYEIPGNTYSVGKTNFWDYEDQLFGISLAPNFGLTGAGLSGEMEIHENFFKVEGIPITPFTDADLFNEDPFQLGLLQVYDQTDQLLASTRPVIPVSNEINCVSSGCHISEQSILNIHDNQGGFDPSAAPILCASCHSSNALGTAGQPGVPSLSEAIHKQHTERTDDCYKCHPGPQTQCLRGVMATQHDMVCQDCHGTLREVGESISNGREPWFDEPLCGDPICHGSQFAEEPGKLFRESRGHGNLFCSACHGEPHAIVPSGNARDNVQNIALQGYSGTLNNCATCHGITPDGPGPHGISAGNCCIGIRGNTNGDPEDNVNISDVTYLTAYLFGIPPGMAPACREEGNVNGDPSESINISDVTYLVAYLFAIPSGPAPPSCP